MNQNKGNQNMGKNLNSACCQNLLDHVKQSATDAVKTASKRAIQKAAEANGDLIIKLTHLIID